MNWIRSALIKLIARHALNGVGAWFVSKGFLTGDDTDKLYGAVAVLVAIGHSLWDKRAQIAAELKGLSGSARLVLALLVPVFALGSAGCAGFNQNTHRAVAVTAKGISGGITEDPSTGLYELGVKDVDTSAIILPIFYQTNATGDISVIVPDAVMSSEQGGKAHLFGSGSGTVTIAIGPNACASLLGGAHYPINAPYWTNSAVGLISPAAGLPTTSSTTQTITNGVTNLVTQTSSPSPATQTTSPTGTTSAPGK